MATLVEHHALPEDIADRIPSDPDINGDDPFLSKTSGVNHHRYSHFDTQLFSLGPAASPEQARRAIEARLVDTERRIQDASKLNNTLTHQRTELTERLKEVEKQQNEGDISPELRQKLEEIEKEYNEVGRETARQFLPKSRVSSSEAAAGSPFVGDGKRPVSPSKFESQATNSPSKLSVPNRKQRNQPVNRVHDIEFVTEISTSLIDKVRHLQSLLAEKEQALRSVALEKSRLEVEAEEFDQRLRSLNDSEHRYKDENWNLETQIHEHIAFAKESADREKKLTQAMNILQAEKVAAQKELDEIKLNHAKLAENHATTIKHHDFEIGSLKRNMTLIENERGVLQRKIEELSSQNQELAIALGQNRGRADERDNERGFNDEDFDTAASNVTPEHSPPPSPVKGTPRHSMLESETLKSSLHHAHRMIQNLKGNIHREKTEKLELKRMLQDARDELEARRGDANLGGSVVSKRGRKTESKEFKKPLKPGQLGGLRSSKSEISIDDPNWEDHPGQTDLNLSSGARTSRSARDGIYSFDTSNETSDAFETANERGTETEDFHTGAEELSGSDELTETEGGTVQSDKVRTKRPADLSLTKPGNRNSFQSTASMSGDDYSYEDLKTPVQTQPQRLRLKMNRASIRRSRGDSEEPSFNNSPASFANSSKDGTPQAPSQTLFAELEDLEGRSEEESVDGTPSRKSVVTATDKPTSRPGTAQKSKQPLPPLPAHTSRVVMTDSSTMTDGLAESAHAGVPFIIGGGLAGLAAAEAAHTLYGNRESIEASTPSAASDTAGPFHEGNLSALLSVNSNGGSRSRPISTSSYSNSSSQHDPDMDEKLSKFPSPPGTWDKTILAATPEHLATAKPLTMSAIISEQFAPVAEIRPRSAGFDNITKVAEPAVPKNTIVSAPLAFSTINAVSTEPLELKAQRNLGLNNVESHQVQVNAKSNSEIGEPETPKNNIMGSIFGWGKAKPTSAPIIAEDDTRQSPNQSPKAETPESQRPFKEISANAKVRPAKKLEVGTADESSQTALTAQQIDSMLKEKSKRQEAILAEDGKSVASLSSPRGTTTLRTRRSQESIGSVGRARAKMTDPDFVHDTITLKRTGSAGSNRGSISGPHPPLPNDHKQVIAAAAQRVGSSSGNQGIMGPPSLPASSYRANPAFRPRTPSFTTQNTVTPTAGSSRAGTTPRAVRTSGSAEVQTSFPTGGRSRRSSVSSFVSEVDNRFNLRQNGSVPHGVDPNTDPRMIQAITQTMIGEYLWKYTRKTGRGEMSGNRHRRYFWVHPYTRTLYWSDRDPSTAGRAELKAKSVAIEAVRVVTDDNPMPPGLHRKSLVVLTPGRAVKFTASTGQRHETWFNALSYLLLRTGPDGATTDLEEVASGALTRDDVDEFNPGYGSRSSRRGPPSLSSYNSHTTRNESPARQSLRASVQSPGLNQASKSSRNSTGTFSRLSSYWKPSRETSSGLGSYRTRQSLGGNDSIHEASEVHDSAEDLREVIEKQDRESDRLENVRACCDGKHDVGSLSHSSKRGRDTRLHSHTHTHAPSGPSR